MQLVSRSRNMHTAGDGAKAFLSCGVPDLQLDGFVVEKDLFDLEVDTVRGGVEARHQQHCQPTQTDQPNVAPDGCDEARLERVV